MSLAFVLSDANSFTLPHLYRLIIVRVVCLSFVKSFLIATNSSMKYLLTYGSIHEDLIVIGDIGLLCISIVNMWCLIGYYSGGHWFLID